MSKRPPKPRAASSEPPDTAAGDHRLLQALVASREGLSAAQRIAHVGSWEWNIADGSLSWSDETYRIFGFEPRAFDATYSSFLDFVHPDDRESVERAVSEALSEGAHYSIEHRIVRPDGETRIVHERGEAAFDDTGKPVRMLGTVQDVTESVRLREELARSEDFNRSLLDASPEALVLFDEDGSISYVNPAAEALGGFSLEEALGTDVLGYTSDPVQSRAALQKILHEGGIRDLEIGIKTKEGREIQVVFNATKLVDDEGRSRGVLVSGHDISERKRMEDELARSQAYNRGLIEASADGLLTIDRRGIITDVNEQMCRMTGRTRDELIGSRFASYFADPKRARAEVRETFESGVVKDYVLTLVTSKGKELTVSFNAAVYRDEDGEVAGIFASARDISEQKQLEKEMRDAHLYTRSLIEASLDAQMTIDPTGVITDVNAEMEALTGRSRAELIGTRFRQYTTDPSRAAAGIEQVLREGAARDYELTIKAKDGRETEVSFHATTYFDQQGELRGVFVTARDITERKRAEAELRAERKRFNDILEILPAYLVLLTPDYHVPFANRFFRERFGEAHGRRCFEYLFGRSEPCEVCETYKVLKTNAPLRWEWTGPDGRDYDIYDFPFTDADGSPLIMEMGIDVTEQKRVEREIRLQAGQHAAILSTTSDGYWLFDADGRILDVNDAYCQMSGYSRDELLQLRILDLEAGETPEETAERIRRVMESGFDRFETRHRRKNSTVWDVEVSVSFWTEPRRFVLFARDISERKRFEQERQVAHFFDQALDMACIANPDGYFARVNHAFEQALGWTQHELLSRPIIDFVHPDDRETSRARLEERRDSKEAIEFENRYLHKDGSFRWLRWRISPPTDLGLIYGSARDVTEEKRREEEKERELSRIRALAETSAGLVAASKPWDVSDVFFEIALPALGATAGALDIVSQDRIRFETRMFGFPAEFVERFTDRPIDVSLPSGACAREGRELWFESAAETAEQFPDATKILEEPAVEAAIYLPLLSDGEAIACLVAYFPDVRSFREQDRAFARAIAGQCAQALARVRLSEQRERALLRTQALQRVGAALTAAVTPDEVLQVVFDEALSALGADSGALGLLGDDGETIESTRTGFSRSVLERYARVSVNDDLPQAVCIRAGSELWYSSCEELRSDFPQLADLFSEYGYEALACLPLEVEGKTIGYLAARFREQRAFPEGERAFARTVAGQCAQAVARARFYEQRENALERTRLLQRVSAGLTRATSLEEVGKVIEDEVFPTLGVKAGAIGILDGERKNFRLAFSGREPYSAEGFQNLSIDADLPGPTCVRENRALWYESRAALESRFPELPPVMASEKFEAACFLPLRTREEAIGFLSGFFAEAREFSERDPSFIETIAEQCAQALARARLYGELNDSLVRTSALQRASSELSGAATVAEVLQAVFDEGFGIFAVDAGVLGLLSRGGDRVNLVFASTEEDVTELAIDDPHSPGAFCTRSGEEIWIESPEQIPADHPLAAELNENSDGKALFYLPLESVPGERAIGFLAGRFATPRAFDENERAFARSVASRCAQALTRVRLHEELNDSLRRTQALQRVSSELSRAVTTGEVLQVVFSEALRILAADAGAIGLVSRDRKRVEIEYTGVEASIFEIAIDEPGSPAADCVRTGEELWFESLEELRADYPFGAELIEKEGGKVVFYLPLRPGSEDEAIGFLSGRFDEPRHFDEEERVFARSVASLCAQALERARLYEERERILVQTQALESVNSALARAATPAEVGQVIFEHAFAMLGATASGLGLFDESGERFDIVTVGFSEEVEKAFQFLRIDDERPGPASVRAKQAHWYSSSAELLADFPAMSDVLGDAWEAAFFVPLIAGEEVLGYLSGYFEHARAFDQSERAFAQTIASQCAQTLVRARLYEESEQRAEASFVLDQIGDGIFRLDEEGRIRLWNPAAERMTGVPAAEALGKHVEEVFEGWGDPSKTLEPASPDRPAARRSLPFSFGGVELWFSISGVRIANGAVYAFHDITAEHELEQRQHDFIATVSHELRTPLASVYGAVRTLERSGLDPLDRELVLGAAVEQSERLRRLIDEILLAHEAGSTQMRMRNVVIDPLEVVYGVVEGAHQRLPAGFSLELTAAESLPPLHVDPDRLHQVLANLIDNAIKFSPQGGCIRVAVESSKESVLFTVEDEGPGIPARERERIFDRFYRLDPAQSRGVGGSGLGLFICHELVERMGGKIGVDARKGGGSIFSIELPRERRRQRVAPS